MKAISERVLANRSAGIIDGEMVLDMPNFHQAADAIINTIVFEMEKNPGKSAFVEISCFEGDLCLSFQGDSDGDFSLLIGFSEDGELQVHCSAHNRKTGTPHPIRFCGDF